MRALCYIQTKQSLTWIVIKRCDRLLLSTHFRGYECSPGTLMLELSIKRELILIEITLKLLQILYNGFVFRLCCLGLKFMLYLDLIAFRILLRERGLLYWTSNDNNFDCAEVYVSNLQIQTRVRFEVCVCVCLVVSLCGWLVCAG